MPRKMTKKFEVPVFHPTLRDVSGSFEAYIASIERRCLGAGICRIVAPKGWTPRKAGYEDLEFTIPRPIRQHATGRRGLYRTLLVEQKPMSLAKDFRPQAVNDDSLPPATETPEDVERRFWRTVTLRPPLYGADVPGSLFDEDLKVGLAGLLRQPGRFQSRSTLGDSINLACAASQEHWEHQAYFGLQDALSR